MQLYAIPYASSKEEALISNKIMIRIPCMTELLLCMHSTCSSIVQ